jgi:hypothetical protein
MAREIANSPHPTPNPDGLNAPSEPHEAQSNPANPAPEDEALVEEPYDSFFDDVNKMLSQSMAQPAPDPVLGPEAAEDEGSSKRARADDPLARLNRGEKESPRTSEVFRAVVALRGGASAPAQPSAAVPPDFLIGDSPDPETPAAARSLSSLLPGLVIESQGVERRSGSDDDAVGEPGFPWFQILLLSYASAVTLALTWIVLTGRSAHPVDSPATSLTATSDPSPPLKARPSLIDTKSLPPIPEPNITTLGEPVRLGDLKITPLSIAVARVELVGSIDPSKYHVEDSESLVLHLQLTNLSKSQSFVPLELAYLRDQNAPLDRCFIASSAGGTIGAYPLAVESEWSIDGQVCPKLEPGQTVETIIASERGVADRLSSEMTWRFRVRIGPYRTDVIGVRFRDFDVARDPKVCRSVSPPSLPTASPGFASPGS